MPGDSGVLVVTRVRSTTTKCTRCLGCNGHPAFPTPLFGARGKCKPRAHRAARMRSHIRNYSAVIASEAIAVGTLIAERPPHRTVRAAFPHTAPTLGA